MAHPSRSLPQLGDSEAYALLGEPVEAVTPLGHGTRSRVYRLDPAEGRPRVVRLTPRSSGRVARERAVRALTAGCSDIPTLPEVLAPPAAHGLDADVVVMDLLPGEPMSAALQHSSETDAAVLWHHFGRGLAAMHKIAVAGFGLLDGAGRGGFSSWRQFVEATAEAALDEARATPLVDLCDAAARAVAALASSLDGVRAGRLLHGDAQPANVQVRGGRVVAWFDFEFATAGDPLYELVSVASHLEVSCARAQVRWRDALAEGYTALGAAPYEAPERARCYRVVHALRRAEYLSVVGPTLTAEAREAAVTRARTALLRSLASE